MSNSCKHIFLIILFSVLYFNVFAQIDSLPKKFDKKYGFIYVPNKIKQTYGISLGLFGSDVVCNAPYQKISNGLNIQLLGQGIANTFFICDTNMKATFLNLNNRDSLWRKTTHKGLLVFLLEHGLTILTVLVCRLG